MADKRISQLVDRGTIANNDVVPIVVSGAVTTNKATISSIQTFMQGNLDLGVTSVGITLGSSGTDVSVSGSPITSSGNITINIPTASATNRGALSSADWSTFNSKQQAITLTTTGTSGASTLVSGTLNIPNYTTDLSGYVTLGTAQTITAQKTFTTSGSSDTMIISHGSGSGFALDVIKAGSGEAIRVTKTSGSGNAMTISGGNFEAGTIVKTGGTSSQFLKADGSVDSSTYVTTDTTQSISGVKTFSTGSLILAAAGTANSTHLRNSAGDSTTVSGSNVLGFNSSNKIYVSTQSKGGFILGFNNAVSNREYTLQDGSGTLAFTSDISTAVAGYLPLTGGTLTGPLNGTSAAFTGAISGSANTITATTGIAGDFTNNSTTNETLRARNNGSGNIAAFRNASAEVASISNSGGLTLSGALNGTSASFTSGAINGTTDAFFDLNRNASGSAGRVRFQTAGTDEFEIGLKGGVAGFHITKGDATELVTVLTGGNVGIGTASPSTNLTIEGTNRAFPLEYNTGYGNIHIQTNEASTATNLGGSLTFGGLGRTSGPTEKFIWGAIAGRKETSGGGVAKGYLQFGTLNDDTNQIQERMRITSGGYTKAKSNGGNYFDGIYHEFVNNNNVSGDRCLVIGNKQGSNTNNTSSVTFTVADLAGDRLYIYGNGNVVNVNNSYGSLSDIKLKENIKDASPKLDDLLKVKIRNYNLIGEETKQIGVIAQELEEIFPAMVDESEDFEYVEVPQLDEQGNEVLNDEGEVVTTKERVSKGTTTKSVKYSVFVPMLIKAIQELKTEIDSLKNQIK